MKITGENVGMNNDAGFVSLRDALIQALNYIQARFEHSLLPHEPGASRAAAIPARLVASALQARHISVAMASPELPPRELALRMICKEARLNLAAVESGRITDRQWSRIAAANGQLREQRLYIDATPDLDGGALRRHVQKLMSLPSLDVIALEFPVGISLADLAAPMDELTAEFPDITVSLSCSWNREDFLAEALRCHAGNDG